ncbi:MAG: glycosyltransferase family 2 protein [bacterium]|nr:glycosyltransferase family 2 protein [bacterium]
MRSLEPDRRMTFSVVIPAFDEEKNIGPLTAAIRATMDTLGPWELIFIDDGSQDGTFTAMQRERAKDSRVNILRFRRNFGQTAAWAAGFDHARGGIVIVLDADMQNEPADIPAMVETLEREKYDVVSGWRKDRKDAGSLKLGSKVGNWIHRRVTGEKIHDHGCSLKVYRREALQDLELYGEMHRYITALLSWKGFRVGEMPVRHHPRRHGSTKYSIRKKLKGFLDLVIVKFWIQYSTRPMHFFGAIGMACVGIGFLLGGVLGTLWLLRTISLQGRSSPLLAVLLVIIGMQFIMTGVLADIVAKNYYATKKAYSIAEKQGFETEGVPTQARQEAVGSRQ